VKFTGSYDTISWICFTFSVVLLLLAFKAENPNEPVKKNGSNG